MSAKELNDKLLSQLDCPVCFETCMPPIYMCVNGHGVCKKCQSQLDECSSCRAPGTPTLRSVQLEKIAALLKVHCENQSLGCKLTFPMEEMAKHLQDCRYIAFECHLCSLWKGSSKGLKEHLFTKHRSSCIEVPSSGSVKTWESAPFNEEYDGEAYFDPLFFKDNIFWLESKYNSSTHIFSRSMRIVSHDADVASRYSYSIEYEAADKEYKCTVYQKNNVLIEGAAANRNMDVVFPAIIVNEYVPEDVTWTYKILTDPDSESDSSSAACQTDMPLPIKQNFIDFHK